jgi:hypothetical protein
VRDTQEGSLVPYHGDANRGESSPTSFAAWLEDACAPAWSPDGGSTRGVTTHALARVYAELLAGDVVASDSLPKRAIREYRRGAKGDRKPTPHAAFWLGEALAACGVTWCSGAVSLAAAGHVRDAIGVLALLARLYGPGSEALSFAALVPLAASPPLDRALFAVDEVLFVLAGPGVARGLLTPLLVGGNSAPLLRDAWDAWIDRKRSERGFSAGVRIALECARLATGASMGVSALLHQAAWAALEEDLLEQFGPVGLYYQHNPPGRLGLRENQQYALDALRHKALEREQSKGKAPG